MVSILDSCMVIPTAEKMAVMRRVASILATCSPPRGRIIILMSSLGSETGMRDALLILAVTCFTKREVRVGCEAAEVRTGLPVGSSACRRCNFLPAVIQPSLSVGEASSPATMASVRPSS